LNFGLFRTQNLIDEFTKIKIEEFTVLSGRRVQFYTDEGTVDPIEGTGQGRGAVRKYDRKALLDFYIIAEFVKFGLPVKSIRNILKLIRKDFKSRSMIEKKKQKL
jgi:DNA-binding transcriptional MerR regulator